MKRRNLSLRQVGAQVGVSQVTVWRWEHGLATPTEDHLARYAALLGVSPRSLDAELERRKMRRYDRIATVLLRERYG